MTLEEIKKLLENKLNRIENCETQFHIGQKQQIADVLLMLSKLHQPAVISSLPNFEENLIGGNCLICGHRSCLCYKSLGIGNDL